MLPFMDEQELYDQFHLDEPWDSRHNKQLISKLRRSTKARPLSRQKEKRFTWGWLVKG